MKKLAVIIFASLFSVLGNACTTFLLNDGGHFYFGRNYDWITGNGMVMTNARDVKKFSAASGEELSWISKFGSITFNQYGKEFPTGGMNEKGLVVELMWLEESKYPAPDHRPALNVLQWVQYQLDNHSTIEEVIDSDKKIRITAEGTPLHYLVADSSGHTATIEFLDGKMVVHKGDDLVFPVLTNTVYSRSVNQTKDVVNENRKINIPDNSLERFAQACSMISHFNSSGQNALDYSFSILNKVSQGQYTKWSIVYDITARQIHFITSENKSRRTVAFADFSFDCSTPSATMDINNEASGLVGKKFKNLDYNGNKKLVETSVKQSSSLIQITESAVRETIEFYYRTSCTTTKD